MYNVNFYDGRKYNEYHISSVYDISYHADILLVSQVDYSADVDLQKETNVSYFAEIQLQETNDASSYNADVDLQETIDIANYLSDIYITKVNNEISYFADMLLRLLTDRLYDADIDLQDTFDLSYDADIDLQDTFNVLYEADIAPQDTFDASYAADADLQKILNQSFSADIDLKDTSNQVFSGNMLLKDFDVDVAYLGEIIVQTEADISYKADMRLSQSNIDISYNADVDLQPIVDISYVADVLLDRISVYSADIYTESDFTPADWPNSRNLGVNPNDVKENPHTDFPVLLILEAGGINDDWGDLATTLFADIGTTKTEAVKNVVFTNSDGTIKYAHEIAYFSNTASKKYMECYVKIPSLTVDTHIKILHRDDGIQDEQDITQTWSNGYGGVWHLTEQNDGTASGSAIYLDATINNNNAADYVTDTTKPEKLGLSQQFDGDDDYISVGNDNSLNVGPNNFTLSGWIKTPDVELVERGMICKNVGGTGNGWFFSIGVDGKPEFRLPSLGDFEIANTAIDDDSWHHIVVQRNGDDIQFYVDGSADGSRTDFFLPWNISNSNNVVFGMQCGNIALNGNLDEMRICNVSDGDGRTSGWIETEYNSQNDNNSFWNVGPGEATVRGVSYSADIAIEETFDLVTYSSDVHIQEARYALVNTLSRQILDLNSENKVNILGFHAEYIEIILATKSGSTTTIGASETTHSLQIEATVNILDKENYNDNTAERTAVPDGTKVMFEVESVSTSSAMINPTSAKTANGKAETSLVALTPTGTDKVDVLVRAYLDQF